MTQPLSVKSLLWWVGNTALLLLVGSLFAVSMIVNGAAATELLTQPDPYGTPMASATFFLGLFSLLTTSIWGHLGLGVVNKMRTRRGLAALRPTVWLLEFSGLKGGAAALAATLPLICGLVPLFAHRSAWRRSCRRRRDRRPLCNPHRRRVGEATPARRSPARPVDLQTLLPWGGTPRDGSARSARYARYWYVLNNLDSRDPYFTPRIRETASVSLPGGVRNLDGTIVYKTHFPGSRPLTATWSAVQRWDTMRKQWRIVGCSVSVA
jgi:hypothetical protein